MFFWQSGSGKACVDLMVNVTKHLLHIVSLTVDRYRTFCPFCPECCLKLCMDGKHFMTCLTKPDKWEWPRKERLMLHLINNKLVSAEFNKYWGSYVSFGLGKEDRASHRWSRLVTRCNVTQLSLSVSGHNTSDQRELCVLHVLMRLWGWRILMTQWNAHTPTCF